jgi:hypothetical protein
MQVKTAFPLRGSAIVCPWPFPIQPLTLFGKPYSSGFLF